MKVGQPDPRRSPGGAITTGRMTAADAIALLLGPRREEIQDLLDAFFTAWGHTLAYHPKVMQFGCFLLWLEARGARLPGKPDNEKGTVAVGDHRENENGKEGE